MTRSTLHQFYENLYQKKRKENPAYEIYDRLRIEGIFHLIEKSCGPVIIVGSGSGRDYRLNAIGPYVTFTDLSWNALNLVQDTKLKRCCSNALHLPFGNSSMSVIVCSEVLEHIPEIEHVLAEFRRLIKPDGRIVISTPNWWSFFGAARWLGEKIVREEFHSSDQPYDDWKTPRKVRAFLHPDFQIIRELGVWYLPPLHRGESGLSKPLTNLIYLLFLPFEKILGQILPWFGHIYIVLGRPSVKEQ